MRKLIVILVVLAALGVAAPANAAPLSSINSFDQASYAADCDFLSSTGEAAWMQFRVAGTTRINSTVSPYADRPFVLEGTARTTAAGPVATLSATLTIHRADGDVTAQLSFPGGTSSTGLCRPSLGRVSFSVSEAPYVATWPDGSRERGTYSLVYSTSSFGLLFSLVFRLDEVIPPPPPTDPQPVTLHLPDDLTVEATGSGGAAVAFSALATQGDRVFAAACTPATTSTFPFGTTTVECTAGGASGSFTVTVKDTTPPALTLPAERSPSIFSSLLDVGVTGFVYRYQVSAVDAVDGPVDVACDPPHDAELAPGATTITCWAEDSRGNRVERSFVVTLPSLTSAFDLFVASLGIPAGTPIAWLLEPQLAQIRGLLVLLESEEARAQLLLQLKQRLDALGALFRSPFVSAVLGDKPLLLKSKQQSLGKMIAAKLAVESLGSVAAALAACPTCVGAGSQVTLVEAAIRSGALDVAQQELTKLETIVRALRASGVLSPLAADVILTGTRLVHSYLRTLEAFE